MINTLQSGLFGLVASLALASDAAADKPSGELRGLATLQQSASGGLDSPRSAPFSVGSVFTDCPDICPEMVVLPPGRFDHGSQPHSGHPPLPNIPPETVVIERPFAIGRYDVTVREYAAFIQETQPEDVGNCQTDRGTIGPYKLDPNGNWNDPGFEQGPRHPVVCVTVADAKAYAAWLSKKTGRLYRLPTLKEWEYAVRAGQAEDWIYLGNPKDRCALANMKDARFLAKYPISQTEPCDDGYLYTSPVGSYPANAFGLYDIVGNVEQWTDTPGSGSGIGNVAPGGSWFSAPRLAVLSVQPAPDAKLRRPWIGFRLVGEM